MTDAIAAGAAVAAAVFSLVNVLISNRHARLAQVQQWRRESMKETAAKFLIAIGNLEGGTRPPDLAAEAEVLHAELDLIASTECANAGRHLYDLVMSQRTTLDTLIDSTSVTTARLKFLNLCRKDLGVDRFAWPPNTPSGGQH